MFADLQRSFYVMAGELSNDVEQLLFWQQELHEFDSRMNNFKRNLNDLQTHIDDAKYKMLDLETLHVEKMTELEKAFRTIGTNLADGYTGDALLLPYPKILMFIRIKTFSLQTN